MYIEHTNTLVLVYSFCRQETDEPGEEPDEEPGEETGDEPREELW